MKRLIIFFALLSLLVPVKAQLWGNVLKNDTIFTADITGSDTVFVRRLRAPEGAIIWYEFPSFIGTTASVTSGYALTEDGPFQHLTLGSASSIFNLDNTHVMYDAVGDTTYGQMIELKNFTAQYWKTLLRKGNSTADTLIIHYSK